MKSFREILRENNETESWTKEDLIALIQENDFDNEDIEEISDLVLDIIEYGEFDDDDFDADSFDWDNYDWDDFDDGDELDEKMTAAAKKKSAKLRRKPAFKKAMRLKKKCMAKHGDIVRKSAKSGTPKVCGQDGKLHKGMSRKERRQLAKSRKKNKNKLIK